jgi:hypothetical protein
MMRLRPALMPGYSNGAPLDMSTGIAAVPLAHAGVPGVPVRGVSR